MVLPARITLPFLREFDDGVEPCGNCFSRCDRYSQLSEGGQARAKRTQFIGHFGA
jgi:hypothetical protein